MVTPSLYNKPLPNRGRGHSGMYKNEWVSSLLSNLQQIDSINCLLSEFPDTPIMLHFLSVCLPGLVFKTECVAPVLIKVDSFTPYMSSVTQGSSEVIWIFFFSWSKRRTPGPYKFSSVWAISSFLIEGPVGPSHLLYCGGEKDSPLSNGLPSCTWHTD